MSPVHTVSVANIPSEELMDWGPVRLPLQPNVPRLRGQFMAGGAAAEDGAYSAGIWECSPGLWRRHIMEAEFSHWLTGHARFTPEGGQPFDIYAGDTVWFPKRSEGVWEVFETVRKVFIILEPNDPVYVLRKALKNGVKRLIGRRRVSAPSNGTVAQGAGWRPSAASQPVSTMG